MLDWLFKRKEIENVETKDSIDLEESIDKLLNSLRGILVASLTRKLNSGESLESLSSQCDMDKECFEYYVGVPRKMDMETLAKVMVVLGWTIGED